VQIWEVLVAVIASGVITAIVSGWFNRRKTAAEARALDGQALNQAAQGYAALIEALTAQQNETTRQVAELLTRIATAEDEIRDLRDENAALRAEISRLQGLLMQSGVDPHTGKRVTGELRL